MKPPTGASMAPREPLSSAQASISEATNQPTVKVTARRKATSPAKGSEETESDTKKRVRLKPESREQLLDRLRNPQLSLHEASILLRVSRATVRRYADSSRLPCQRTPGGQRRFFLRDIEVFYRQLKKK
ncbi:helix-turn-helix domain-containing protein [bacterium]|nr:MAG: helix-turn-helix domain-containing protein [bacterium]